MESIGKLISSVSQALDFNHATLSGCVDIIVVKQPDGSLKSTPFHVRFGKLKVLKSRDKIVKIRVNGTEAPFDMKLGEAGEGFFEQQVVKQIVPPTPIKKTGSAKEKQVITVSEPLVIPETKISMANLAPPNQESNINQNPKSLKQMLQLKQTPSNEKTRAQTKGIDDQNDYDPYADVEDAEKVKEAIQTDLDELILGDEVREKAVTMDARCVNIDTSVVVNQEGFLPCLSKSAPLSRSALNQKVKVIKVKTLRPTSDQLKSLNLRQGANNVTYTIESGLQGVQTLSSNIYFWPSDANIIISDVDGTITKSDILGHILHLVGKDWSQPGIAPLFTNLRRNGYHILYLTSRPIGQAEQTKNFIHSVYQDGKMMPHGPLIMSPDRMLPSVKREIIFRRPEIFKMAVLKDIRSLFPADHNPFHAGFGNRETDAIAYRSVKVPLEKVFIVNPEGHIHHHNNTVAKSYALINTMIKEMFPGVSKRDNKAKLAEALDPANALVLENQEMEANVMKVVS